MATTFFDVGLEPPPKPKKVHQRNTMATTPSTTAQISFFCSLGFLMSIFCIGLSALAPPFGRRLHPCHAESKSPYPNASLREIRAIQRPHPRRLRSRRLLQSRVPVRQR